MPLARRNGSIVQCSGQDEVYTVDTVLTEKSAGGESLDFEVTYNDILRIDHVTRVDRLYSCRTVPMQPANRFAGSDYPAGT